MGFGGKTNINRKLVGQITDVRNIALYIFVIIVLAITWSGVKAVQNNYELQKQITTLRQENEVIKLQNETAALQNRYLRTEQYLELSGRQNLGLAAPGEKVLLVPKETAMKYIDPKLVPKEDTAESIANRGEGITQNIEDWRNFLLGRKVVQ